MDGGRTDSETLIDEGVELQKRGDVLTALDRYERALALGENPVRAHHNRATALMALGRNEEALDSCNKALKLNPDYLPAMLNRGYLLQLMVRDEDAIECYDRLLAVNPRSFEALHNRANALRDLNRQEESIEYCDRALALRPDDAEVLCSKAHAMLALGDLPAGFRLREARASLPRLRRWALRTEAPVWDGHKCVQGKRLLLHAEEGLGDSIHFIRYLPMVRERGARVFLRVPSVLHALFEQFDGVESVTSEDTVAPGHDFHCPLSSLPFVFGATLQTIPAAIPYLTAPADRVAYWRRRIPSREIPVGGIVWAGNPRQVDDRRRSMSLRTMLECLIPGINWVSLQYKIPERDRATLAETPWLGHSGIEQWGKEAHGLAEAAAQIACVDFVITVDTAAAHLAGAMGRPVWILLGFGSDWRWLLNRSDSPWYPTATLFRQTTPGDWSAPLRQVAERLSQSAFKP